MYKRALFLASVCALYAACHPTTYTSSTPHVPPHVPPHVRVASLPNASAPIRVMRQWRLNFEHVTLTPRRWLEPSPLYRDVQLMHAACQGMLTLREGRSPWRRARAWVVDVKTDERHGLAGFDPAHLVFCTKEHMLFHNRSGWNGRVALFDLVTRTWIMPELQFPGALRKSHLSRIIPIPAERDGAQTFLITMTAYDEDYQNAGNYHGIWSPQEAVVRMQRSTLWDGVSGVTRHHDGVLSLNAYTKTLVSAATHEPSRHGTCCGPQYSYTHAAYTLDGDTWRLERELARAPEPQRDAYTQDPNEAHHREMDDESPYLQRPITQTVYPPWGPEGFGLGDLREPIFLDTRDGTRWRAHATILASHQAYDGTPRALAADIRLTQGTTPSLYLLDFDAGTQLFIDTYEDCPGVIEPLDVAGDVVALRCIVNERQQGKIEEVHMWSEVLHVRRATRWRAPVSWRVEHVLQDGRVLLRDLMQPESLWIVEP